MRNTTILLAGAAGLSLALSACETTDSKAVSTTTTEKSATSADGDTATTTTTTTTSNGTDSSGADATTTSTTESTTTTDAAATGSDTAVETTTTTTTTGAVRAATQADVKVGASVSDSAGVSFGKVEAVDAAGVTISSGSTRAKLPLSSVGVGPKGLMISITKAEFDAAVKAAG